MYRLPRREGCVKDAARQLGGGISSYKQILVQRFDVCPHFLSGDFESSFIAHFQTQRHSPIPIAAFVFPKTFSLQYFFRFQFIEAPNMEKWQ